MKKYGVAQGSEFYDTVYQRYEGNPELIKEGLSRFRALAEEVSRHVIGSVLDLGCGFGFLAEFVEGAYVGVDFSPVAVQVARENSMNPQAKFMLADIRYFESSTIYDTVVALETLEHLDDPVQAVELAKRLATQRIIISVPRDMPGTAHVWPTWRARNVVRVLGAGARVYRYKRWRIGILDIENA
jgi:SAM-dependent methyltransferase